MEFTYTTFHLLQDLAAVLSVLKETCSSLCAFSDKSFFRKETRDCFVACYGDIHNLAPNKVKWAPRRINCIILD